MIFFFQMCSCSLFITKEQSLGEAGQSEKWGQGHSEAQVRLIYHTASRYRGLCLKTCFSFAAMTMLCFFSDGLKVSTGTDSVDAC